MTEPQSPGPTANKQKSARQWHYAHENILKEWGEAAACYRFMHYNAYKIFKKRNIRFTLPIIVISTVTGTANFAQSTFPASWQKFVPSVIGAMNLFTAILTTVMQFLKINELMESHRVSYVSYAKLARNIRLELSLPITERSQHGSTMVDTCGTEYGRLIEQSPNLPTSVILNFEKEFGIAVKQNKFSRPEFMGIRLIRPFKGTRELNILDAAVLELSERTKGLGAVTKSKTVKYQSAKDSVLEELRKLRESKQDVVVNVGGPGPSYGLSISRLVKLFEEGDSIDEEYNHEEEDEVED